VQRFSVFLLNDRGCVAFLSRKAQACGWRSSCFEDHRFADAVADRILSRKAAACGWTSRCHESLMICEVAIRNVDLDANRNQRRWKLLQPQAAALRLKNAVTEIRGIRSAST
jgi:hypothetical protein